MKSHATLIAGGSKRERQKEIQKILNELIPQRDIGKRHPDLRIISVEENRKNISILQIRDLVKFLSRKPFTAKVKVAILLEANLMTKEAQNSLLKTLEEPPENSSIVLETQNPLELLPTITSRCHLLKLRAKLNLCPNHEEYTEQFLKLMRKSRGERLDWIEENKDIFKDRNKVGDMLASWLSVLRDHLLESKSERYIKQIKNLEKITEIISKYNVTPRLGIEVFLLNM